MSNIMVSSELAHVGMKVVRGRDWKWQDQDGRSGAVGTIIKIEGVTEGWCQVDWNGFSGNVYRIGAEGCYDLYIYVPKAGEVDAAKKLKEAREKLAESILKAETSESLKSDKHGSTSTGSTGPFKVRRPISTIQGPKRRIYSPIKS